jgi:misacylated tRNA(Ala) deacylase
MTEELFATDAYRRSFDAAVVATDRDAGRVALDRTAFTRVAAVSRRPRHRGLGRRAGRGHSREAGGGRIWHCLDAHELPGGNIEPGSERLDFPLESISAELGRRLEARINEELAAARAVVVEFLGRAVADADPALVRTAANLIPREIDPLRVIDIVGLDKQADGGTHVQTTDEVGRIRVIKTENKGKGFKRVRLEVVDA